MKKPLGVDTRVCPPIGFAKVMPLRNLEWYGCWVEKEGKGDGKYGKKGGVHYLKTGSGGSSGGSRRLV